MPKWRRVADYVYTNEFNIPQHMSRRFVVGGEKKIRPYHYVGGHWVLGKTERDQRYIYNLPKVLQAVEHGVDVWICDGEKDAEALIERGVTATCGQFGMGAWQKRYGNWLREAHVVIVADRRAGVQQAAKVAALLDGVVTEFRCVQAAEGNDAFDHFAAGFDLNDFIEVDIPIRKVVGAVGGGSVPTLEELLRRAIEESTSVGRNKAGMNLIHQMRDNKHNADAALETLVKYQEAVEFVEDKPDDRFDWNEAWELWNKHWFTAAREPWDSPLLQEVKRTRIRRQAHRIVLAEERGPIRWPQSYTLDQLSALNNGQTPFIIGELWAQGTRVLLSAMRKAGKTTMTTNLLRSLVSSDDFLGRFPVQISLNGKVGLIDNEMNTRQLDALYSSIGMTNAIGRNVNVWPMRGMPQAMNILDREVFDWWCEEIKRSHCELLILDVLGGMLTACGLSENSNDDVGRLFMRLDELQAACDLVGLMLNHHMGHAEERARGASRMRGLVDAEWFIIYDRDEFGRELSGRFFRALGREDIDVPESPILFDPHSHELRLGEYGKTRAASAQDRTLLEILAYVGEHPGCPTTEACGGDHNKTALVARLEREGYIERRVVQNTKYCTLTELGENAVKHGYL